jgi:glycosyltransferase involved in cell wall biosynthesis
MIHIHWAIPTGLIGLVAGALLRKPFIVTVHGSDFRLATDRSSLINKIFVYVCVRAKHLHCVSEMMTQEIEKLGIGRKKISVFPMGIDQDFLEVGKKKKMSPNHRSFTIVSNRNLLPIYNVSLLVRSIPIVLREEPNVRFLIAGDGAERERLEKEVENLKVKKFVQFLGRIAHEKMPDLLSEVDIYVSTSLYDGTSVSLLEALASGTFPIVTNIPSNREWISDGENGFLVPIDQERFLAEKIVEAIRNQDLLERSRDKNFRLIKEKALWPITIAKTEEIYKLALESKM